MLQYLIAGVVVGGIYCLVSTGLIVTYRSSGILNFAYGALAYFIARTYYYFHSQRMWPIWLSVVVAVCVIAPLLGALLWWLLFRHLQNSSTLIKIIGTIGLSVALPELAILIFGNVTIDSAPGLAPVPVASYNVGGVAITLDQVIVAICVVSILVIGWVITKFTMWGLLARAMVDSSALTEISGISPQRIAVTVWSLTTALAGLVGVLVAPIIGLSPVGYAQLVASVFAAVILARLTHVARAIVVALLIGIVTSMLQYWLPPTSQIAGGALQAIPFGFILIALLIFGRNSRTGLTTEPEPGGALDRAIQPAGEKRTAREEEALANAAVRLHDSSGRKIWNRRTAGGLIPLALAALVPIFLGSYWLGLVGEGFCFGLIFLAFVLCTGEGGMIWLCLVSFAGLGAVFAGYLITAQHWPILLACLVAAFLVMPGGLIIGVITTRLGNLYVALVTLAFGVLIDTLVFPLNVFAHGDVTSGVALPRPSWGGSDLVMTYVALGAFCLAALAVEHFRRSTAGLSVTAVRWSDLGARTVGLSSVQLKVMVAVEASFLAAFGGALLAVFIQGAAPATYGTLSGLVWLVVVVSIGTQSNLAALIAGLAFTIIPGLFVTYLPSSLTPVPQVIFGVGAIILARNPQGALAQNAEYARHFGSWVSGHLPRPLSRPRSTLPMASDKAGS